MKKNDQQKYKYMIRLHYHVICSSFLAYQMFTYIHNFHETRVICIFFKTNTQNGTLPEGYCWERIHQIWLSESLSERTSLDNEEQIFWKEKLLRSELKYQAWKGQLRCLSSVQSFHQGRNKNLHPYTFAWVEIKGESVFKWLNNAIQFGLTVSSP